MAYSIHFLSKFRLIMSKIRSTYSFKCQCQFDDFDAISAQPAEAEASGKEQAAEKKRPKTEKFTCQARQRLLRRLLLIYLSTLLILTRRRRPRLYLTNLQKCLKDRKFCAKRALGRLFRTPLMNWSGTSTSRGLPTKTGSSTGSKIVKRRFPSSSMTALRLEQKTSGLFNSAEAGNGTVAGVVSGSGFQAGKMEPVSPEPGEFLGELFQEMPSELPGTDYLDSFMDLSNFLIGDLEGKDLADDDLVEAFDHEMMDKVDFSGILTSLKEEAKAFTVPSTEVVTSSTPDQSRKRKLAETEVVEEPYIGNCITVNMMDIEQLPDSSTSDHDYVIKKPRLASTSSEIESPSPNPISSSVDLTATPKTKYRERRDKNNEASRRSRQIRKQKYIEMESEADVLEAKNDKLREKIVELENLAKLMKAELIKQMTKK